ncbi:hypothetical protein RchiOBHm_Chr5g0027911 [Rosa chinensis]|uniref:Uncharacterized protein n=1 Tax=Rosa chinensis TaxID=74649 RepID=A0A2P6Q988_ROSCH|nr:hypothetical protein RchiOBHm_Chr5g0027911 [Rosa chinensis]
MIKACLIRVMSSNKKEAKEKLTWTRMSQQKSDTYVLYWKKTLIEILIFICLRLSTCIGNFGVSRRYVSGLSAESRPLLVLCQLCSE